MKIGIDLDGVVIDSEKTFRIYEQIYDIEVLKGNNLIDKEANRFQKRYKWSEEQGNNFINNYFLKVSKESNIMPGFKVVYNLLKQQKHEFVVITGRGCFLEEMKLDAERLLKENGIEFDKFYWAVRDKLAICQKENVDIMIDDDYDIVKSVSEGKIKTIYMRDKDLKKLEENEFIKEVNDWGDIYKYLKSF